MNYTLLLAVDRGGHIALIFAIALLTVDLVSLPLMPFFHFIPNKRLKHIVARVYRILGVVTVILGFILIPVVLVIVTLAVVVRVRGTGIPQSLSEFIFGCALGLAAPLVYITLGWFQMWFSERLAPEIDWDNKKQRSLRRRMANLGRTRNCSMTLAI